MSWAHLFELNTYVLCTQRGTLSLVFATQSSPDVSTPHQIISTSHHCLLPITLHMPKFQEISSKYILTAWPNTTKKHTFSLSWPTTDCIFECNFRTRWSLKQRSVLMVRYVLKNTNKKAGLRFGVSTLQQSYKTYESGSVFSVFGATSSPSVRCPPRISVTNVFSSNCSKEASPPSLRWDKQEHTKNMMKTVWEILERVCITTNGLSVLCR